MRLSDIPFSSSLVYRVSTRPFGIVIEDKELALYTQNLQTIGTQAALLMGFAFAAIYEVKDTMEHMPDAFQVISPWSDQG